MTKEEILTKVISKAVKNGFDVGNTQNCTIWFLQELKDKRFRLVVDHMYSKNEYMRDGSEPEGKSLFGEENNRYYDIEAIIFNHKFARAFWAGELYCEPEGLASWQYHLKELAIAEDRLTYLSKFI